MAQKKYSLIAKIMADISDFQKKMNTVQKNVNRAGKNISKAGSALTKGLTVPIMAGAVALGAMAMKAVSSADELQKMADVTGISIEELQRMKFVGGQLGVELETITGAQRKLTNAVADASNGNTTSIKAFESLGVAIYDSNGKMKDANTIFNEVLDGLGKIEDPILRDALAMDLMGKSAMDLNPLIKAGSASIEDLKNQADDMGIVVNGDVIAAIDEFGDRMDAVKQQAGAAGQNITYAMLPVLNKLLDVVQEIIPPIEKFAKMLADGFTSLPEPVQDFLLIMIGLLAIIGPILLGIGWMVSAFAPLISILSITTGSFTVLGVAVNLSIGWIILIIVGLIAVIFLLWKNWDKIVGWMKGAFDWLGKGIEKIWEGIVDGIETQINGIIWLINQLIKGINLIPGIKIPLIPKVDFNGNGKDLLGSTSNTTKESTTTNVSVNLDGKKISSYTDNSIGGRSIAQGGAY